MKKYFALAFIFTCLVVFSFTSCGPSMGGQVKGESFKTEGWVDNDTFRLVTMGVAKKTLTNKVQRRASAQEAAVLDARRKILEKFKGAKTEAASGMSDFEMTGVAVASEVAGVVAGGSVIKATYDTEDNCEVVYEVKAKGLKKKVSAADIK